MLEDAIAISKKTLDEHDFETDGVEVRENSKPPNILLPGKQPPEI